MIQFIFSNCFLIIILILLIGYFFWYFPPLKEGAACQSDNFPESDSPACITMEHDVAVNELGVGAGHKG